ncbi:helix-turn-helix domain-containing protein [Enterococcus sp.]|uniref:helix-turn-helix domain-containing protein n=1 Tax=Enterococcus sp. TaxID=35783 RepID=UPI00290BB714|nr:helix-turn-helix domain-containing protein [Enterococcus sp.]MDU5337315.1 helix-turn-helix domain-containing protein [Enterococcus sp.]
MSPNDLLIIDDRYKWYVAQLIEIKRNSYCSLTQISEILDFSPYKAETYFEELVDDLEKIGQPKLMELSKGGEVLNAELTHLLIKKLRVHYVEKSPAYQMFHLFMTKEISLDSQLDQEKINLSRSGAYKYQKNLKKLLSDENVQLKKNKLLGNEFQLRNFLFGIYYELFNGIKNPFEEATIKLARNILNYFIHFYETGLVKTKEIKLIFFLCIWLTRLKYNHVIDTAFISVKKEGFFDYLHKLLSEQFFLNPQQIELELAYFYLFVYLEDIDKSSLIDFLPTSVEQQAKQLTTSFFDNLASRIERNGETLAFSTNDIEEFQNINRKWLIYHFKESTFITKGQIRYFQEINPLLDEFIQEFIEKAELRSLFLSKQEKTKLYYDYLFFVITKIPIERLEKPLHICIDFSHGRVYNDYIRRMLSSLQSMNIRYEQRLSTKTKLYLSDFAIDTLPCKQVIWKRPPTPGDWKALGDLLVGIRGGMG